MMERPIVNLPTALCRLTGVDWFPNWREQSAGTGTGGRRNIVLGALPRWEGAVPVVLPPSLIGQWRAMLLTLRGQTGILRVRMFDRAVSLATEGAPVGFDDGAFFDDGAGFDSFPVALALRDAPAGASVIDIDETGVAVPVAVGQILSHGDWPFAVTSRQPLGGGIVRLGVAMPLRAAIPAGDPVDLIGAGLFELAETGGVPAYGLDRVTRPALRLSEWLR